VIPQMNVVAWGSSSPGPIQGKQDLIISRALVELFTDAFLRAELRFRGGTALNKLHLPKPLRYSEDIDLVRTSSGPIGPVLDKIRDVLEPWLGHASFDQSPVAPKLRFRVEAEDKTSPAPIRLKIEVHTREIVAYDPPRAMPFEVKNPWFSGRAEIATFSNEEILATKLRALLQRDKGRDLIDLSHAAEVFKGLDHERVVALLQQYLATAGQGISRAQAEQRMFAKLANPGFMADVRPLLSADEAERFDGATARAAFRAVFLSVVKRFPGQAWARTEEMAARFGMAELAKD